MRLATSLAAVAVCAPLAVAAEIPVREAVSELERPDHAPFGDARGACDIREGGDFQRFRVAVEGVGGDAHLHVLLGDGHEQMHGIGSMTHTGHAHVLHLTTLEGGALPYHADSVRTLAERRIEVRDADGRLVLAGRVPAFREAEEPHHPAPPHHEPRVARSEFHRTDHAHEHESRGVVVAILRADSSGLRIELGRLAPETGHLVYIESGDEMVLVDDLRTNGDGAARLAWDTEDGEGADLPLGADGVGELAGRRVEVRDLLGRVLLYAEVPAVAREEDVEPVHEEARHEDEETGTDVRIVVDIRPARGREDLRIVVRDVPRDASREGDRPRGAKRTARRVVEVRLADDDGSLSAVAYPRVRGGRAAVRFTTRRGRELPHGAESLRDLSGRAFEVFLGGARIASGSLPQF